MGCFKKYRRRNIHCEYISKLIMGRKYIKGVSIIETLVYIAIVGFLVVFVVNSALGISTAANKTRLQRNILGEAGIGTERIVREIRLAKSVVVSDSVFGNESGILKLDTVKSST